MRGRVGGVFFEREQQHLCEEHHVSIQVLEPHGWIRIRLFKFSFAGSKKGNHQVVDGALRAETVLLYDVPDLSHNGDEATIQVLWLADVLAVLDVVQTAQQAHHHRLGELVFVGFLAAKLVCNVTKDITYAAQMHRVSVAALLLFACGLQLLLAVLLETGVDSATQCVVIDKGWIQCAHVSSRVA